MNWFVVEYVAYRLRGIGALCGCNKWQMLDNTYVDNFFGRWSCIMEYRIIIDVQVIQFTLRQ